MKPLRNSFFPFKRCDKKARFLILRNFDGITLELNQITDDSRASV